MTFIENEIDDPCIELINNNETVKVSWCNLGEGWNGDYNEDDPDDENLLRFDVDIKQDGEWFAVDDASYCTQIPVTTDHETLKKLLEYIMAEIEEPLQSEHSIKKICEKLSWIEPAWIERG